MSGAILGGFATEGAPGLPRSSANTTFLAEGAGPKRNFTVTKKQEGEAGEAAEKKSGITPEQREEAKV